MLMSGLRHSVTSYSLATILKRVKDSSVAIKNILSKVLQNSPIRDEKVKKKHVHQI